METDPFDEFNMRPITGGLGFHKKTTQLGMAMRKVTKDAMGPNLPKNPPKGLVDDEETGDTKRL